MLLHPRRPSLRRRGGLACSSVSVTSVPSVAVEPCATSEIASGGKVRIPSRSRLMRTVSGELGSYAESRGDLAVDGDGLPASGQRQGRSAGSPVACTTRVPSYACREKLSGC
jgi:hypothetical protein